MGACTEALKSAGNMTWEDREEETNRLIKTHTYGSMGFGSIPMPLVDFLALTNIQIRLLYKLSKLYGVSFSKDRAKRIISSLISSFMPVAATGPISSMVKTIPIIGRTSRGLAVLASGDACTYALGKIFARHFESGGTFLDFNPEAVREHFADQFEKGKKIAAEKNMAPVKAKDATG